MVRLVDGVAFVDLPIKDDAVSNCYPFYPEQSNNCLSRPFLAYCTNTPSSTPHCTSQHAMHCVIYLLISNIFVFVTKKIRPGVYVPGLALRNFFFKLLIKIVLWMHIGGFRAFADAGILILCADVY